MRTSVILDEELLDELYQFWTKAGSWKSLEYLSLPIIQIRNYGDSVNCHHNPNCRLIRLQVLTTVVGVEGYWIVIPAAWMTAFR